MTKTTRISRDEEAAPARGHATKGGLSFGEAVNLLRESPPGSYIVRPSWEGRVILHQGRGVLCCKKKYQVSMVLLDQQSMLEDLEARDWGFHQGEDQ